MKFLNWFFGIGHSHDEVTKSDYRKLSPEQIEIRERVNHRLDKIDQMSFALEGSRPKTKMFKSIGLEENTSEIIWSGEEDSEADDFEHCDAIIPLRAKQLKASIVFKSRFGPLRASAGDYLVKLPNGDMTAMSADAFERAFRFK